MENIEAEFEQRKDLQQLTHLNLSNNPEIKNFIAEQVQ